MTCRCRLIVLVGIALLAGAAGLHAQPALAGSKPAGAASKKSGGHPEWAQPVEEPGLPNLNRVNDSLYRSAQPKPHGYAQLKKLGIKTIICLRNDNTDEEHAPAEGIRVVHIGMRTWKPTVEEVVAFLKTATDPKNEPVLVHCKHGADRTGLMVAVYRICVDGWSKQEAIEEMTEGGFGFHSIWQNIVRFIRKLDVDQVKKEAGLKP